MHLDGLNAHEAYWQAHILAQFDDGLDYQKCYPEEALRNTQVDAALNVFAEGK